MSKLINYLVVFAFILGLSTFVATPSASAAKNPRPSGVCGGVVDPVECP